MRNFLSRSESTNRAPDGGVVLLLQVPRTNDKKELAAEQMFASLYGLLTIPAHGLFATTLRERISFEIAVIRKRIGFYVWVPEYLKTFVEEQMYAQYPSVQISEVPDYTFETPKAQVTLATELKYTAPDVLPIKTFQSFEVDPLAAITATLAKFEDHEEAWLQLIIKPAPQNWHRKSERYIARRRGGGSASMSGLVTALWTPPTVKTDSSKPAEYDQIRARGAEEKSQKLAFEVQLRVVYRGNTHLPAAKLRMQSILASYKQFNTTYLNGFEHRRIADDPFVQALYQKRLFNNRGYIANIEEVATLYHLPHTSVETPYILWASSQTAEPPANIPVVNNEFRHDLSPVATTNFRGHNTMFGMPRSDRNRHVYIIGQTGVGKSGLLELMTISDIYSPYGFAVIDPHGDYAIDILRRIPAERADDVIYFNPADTDFPMAFNPMEVTDPKLKSHTASELIGVLKRMFESWGPRLEYILRYSLLALLDYPQATMLDITRILTDKQFRNEVLRYVQDPVVKNFWTVEFASWNDKFAAEAVAPVLNKVGAFTANPLVRNIIGQPKSSFNIRQIMDEHKILLVNLSRGLLGEDNASLLGALLVTKIQLAAMSRADIPASQRTPFYLYVDEFQNFATDSFATILSEARKYGLNLTVANQYTAQMAPEVKDAVFGNVGTIIAFRMGADDARVMLRYFDPRFGEYDLVHMHNRHFVVSMTIEGEKTPAFSAISLNLPPQRADFSEAIINHSRALYGSSRDYVERYIADRYHLEASVKGPTPAPKREAARPAKPVLPRQAELKQIAAEEVPTREATSKPVSQSVVLQSDAAHVPLRAVSAGEVQGELKIRHSESMPATKSAQEHQQGHSSTQALKPQARQPAQSPTEQKEKKVSGPELLLESAQAVPSPSPKRKRTRRRKRTKAVAPPPSDAVRELPTNSVISLK
ncbi:MAG TPA: type IV secretion system DNA-binding domain-containing protein [Candidatus Limnocylindrales bacterium]|nr:type IV secretion system DNA-binding domain-containing protein [Candidatus Limnocylindrales bacterium]